MCIRDSYWAKRDPIALYEKFLLGNGVSQNDLVAIAARVDQELTTELATAEASPMPEGNTATTDVYFGSTAEDATPEIVRQSRLAKGR